MSGGELTPGQLAALTVTVDIKAPPRALPARCREYRPGIK